MLYLTYKIVKTEKFNNILCLQNCREIGMTYTAGGNVKCYHFSNGKFDNK